jgi:exosome complex component CSL4
MLVIPGQKLFSLSESLVSGEGTYERDGVIYSSLVGTVMKTKITTTAGAGDNEKDLSSASSSGIITGSEVVKVSVIRCEKQDSSTKMKFLFPSVGSVVTCRVTRVNPQIASVEILLVQGHAVKEGFFSGMIRKENVRAFEEDTVEMHECFRLGDIVLAQVAAMGGVRSYELSTARNELGVIYAKSSSAKGVYLVPVSWDTMKCPISGVTEHRKVAKPVSKN